MAAGICFVNGRKGHDRPQARELEPNGSSHLHATAGSCLYAEQHEFSIMPETGRRVVRGLCQRQHSSTLPRLALPAASGPSFWSVAEQLRASYRLSRPAAPMAPVRIPDDTESINVRAKASLAYRTE